MALSQATSFIDGSRACDGTLRVCLRHDDGSPFFDQFDICGGPATGNALGSTTGPNAGSLNGCSLTNFATEDSAQCFDLNNYTPASPSSTADTILIQPTNQSNEPIGSAVAIGVTFAACDGSDAFRCLDFPNGMPVESGSTVAASAFVTGGSAPYNVTNVTGALLTITQAGGVQILAGVAPGQYTRSLEITDANGVTVECTVQFVVSEPSDNGGGDCIDTAISYARPTSQFVNTTAGVTVTIESFVRSGAGASMDGYYLLIKDPAGNIQAQAPEFQGSDNDDEQVWRWQVPNNCTNGAYQICIFPPNGSNCPEVDGATITVSGCGGATGQCKTAQVSLVANSTAVITPGQVVAGATAFGSSNPAQPADPTIASISSQSAGAISLAGVAVGQTTITVDMGNGQSCECTVNITASTGCSSTVTGLIASPANPAPGQVVTLTATGCSCTGCVVRITQQQVAGMPTVQLSNGGETVSGGSVSFTNPTSMQPGQALRFNTQCCCPQN